MTRMVLLAIAAVMAVSCRTHTEYIPAASVRTDTVRIVSLQRDSIRTTDSVYVAVKGDTVRIERWRIRERWRVERDTLWRVRTDSVAVPYPVERRLSRWERTKQEVGGVALGIVFAALSVAVVWLLKRIRRK